MSTPILPGTEAYERLVVELRAGRLSAAAFVAILENARAVVEAARGFVIAKTDAKPGSQLWFNALVRAIAKYDERTQ